MPTTKIFYLFENVLRSNRLSRCEPVWCVGNVWDSSSPSKPACHSFSPFSQSPISNLLVAKLLTVALASSAQLSFAIRSVAFLKSATKKSETTTSVYVNSTEYAPAASKSISWLSILVLLLLPSIWLLDENAFGRRLLPVSIQ